MAIVQATLKCHAAELLRFGSALQSIAFLQPGNNDPYLVQEVHVNAICLGMYRRYKPDIGGIVHLPGNETYNMRNDYLTWLVEDSMFSDAYEWADIVDHDGNVLVKDCIVVKPVKCLVGPRDANMFGMLCCLIRHDWEYKNITSAWKYFVDAGVGKDFAYVLAQSVATNGSEIKPTLHNPVGPLLKRDIKVVSWLLKKELFGPTDTIGLTHSLKFEGWAPLTWYTGQTLEMFLQKNRAVAELNEKLWPFKRTPKELLEGPVDEVTFNIGWIVANWKNILEKILATSESVKAYADSTGEEE